MNKRVWAAFPVFLSLLGCVFGQVDDNRSPVKPRVYVTNPTCFGASIELRDLNDRVGKDTLIIIISYLGDGDLSETSLRRLHNSKTFLTKGMDLISLRPSENVVTADGNKVSGNGYLDFFIEGHLELRLYLRKKQDVPIPPCVKEPEEEPCSTPFARLFYPCLGQKKNKR